VNGALPRVDESLAAVLRKEPLKAALDAISVRELLEAAGVHGVATLVADRLRTAAAGSSSAQVRAPLDRECAMGAAGEALRQREVAAVLQSLADAGLKPVLLKGAALAYSVYDDPSHRARFDTDLFVRREDLPAVDEVMTRRGYVRASQVTGELVMHQVDYLRKDAHGIRHVYDFHWKLANRQAVAQILTFEEVSAAAVAVDVLAPAARAIGRVHALLHACVHRVAHHPGDERLVWLYDIHLLMTSLSRAEATQFETLATSRGVGAICADGLAAARRWLATPVPDGLVHRLEAAAGANGREPSAALLNGDSGSFREFISDIRALPDWTRRARLVYEHAFPPPRYMTGAYMVSNRIWLPALYTHRIVRGAWRWVRGAAR
jgi:hypothetical protein